MILRFTTNQLKVQSLKSKAGLLSAFSFQLLATNPMEVSRG